MSQQLVLHRETSQAIALPPTRTPIAIRLAVPSDLKFIDALQKKHTEMVGFIRRSWFEKRIEWGQVLIAEEASGISHQPSGFSQPDSPSASSASSAVNNPIGYIMFSDNYCRREELGIVYQLNVAPGKRRGLVGAALVKAAFERCPYGVKLFCCWCAQDIEANHFWESIGFVPLAFRAGSRTRGKRKTGETPVPRMQIFWQRRIREGDVGPGATPYWFPAKTDNGAMREQRIVLPIPPGTHWSDAKPAVLPEIPGVPGLPASGEPMLEALPGAGTREKSKRERKPRPPAAKMTAMQMGGLRFAPPTQATAAKPEAAKPAKPPRPPRTRMKNDPKYVAAAREWRDRYLEQVNSGLILPEGMAKYDVSRQLPGGFTAEDAEIAERGDGRGPPPERLLEAA